MKTCSRKFQRHTCQRCLNARALFFFHGRVSARLDHDLCPRCFRSLMQSERAHQLQEG